MASSLSNKLANEIFTSLSDNQLETVILALRCSLESTNGIMLLSKQQKDFILSLLNYYQTLT